MYCFLILWKVVCILGKFYLQIQPRYNQALGTSLGNELVGGVWLQSSFSSTGCDHRVTAKCVLLACSLILKEFTVEYAEKESVLCRTIFYVYVLLKFDSVHCSDAVNDTT
jgi:hypothetical protein